MGGSFSHREKVARQRRMRATPPHDFVVLQNRGAGYPHPALRATLSQRERARAKNRFHFSTGAGSGGRLESSQPLIS
jgi:hypothetical protein